MLEAVARTAAAHLELVPSAAGLHVTALLRDAVRGRRRESSRRAEHGVAVESLSPYYARRVAATGS